jgi:hypothetical protein
MSSCVCHGRCRLRRLVPATATATRTMHRRLLPPDPQAQTHTRPSHAATESRRDEAGSVTSHHPQPWRRRPRQATTEGRDGRAHHTLLTLGENSCATAVLGLPVGFQKAPQVAT